ncbi:MULTISPECIES: hypothetical protein [unclassified Sphingomonas]|uniref:hypothetical protein n=1 Tax=unclassified Sphingomonas TaxID=196159 RepID=UPI0006FB0DB2|nr:MULTISPECIES: hypothetical protein [unclassified Sphingomonas]KQM57278.1 hypothetical protein ASE65_13245 [Sphingomonas sp. Leaf16]KQN10453.1 hypothetical protein ASE81_13290 [Sphingomonas sp. Leaf29]KQN18254.1 hypothetical protein ASE83_13225 [Sphingomonas sp. Leaf32]
MLLAALLLQAGAPPANPYPVPGDDPRCDRSAIRYTPEREWSGIWVNHFEGSQFFEGKTGVAAIDWRQRGVWFDDRDNMALTSVAMEHRGSGKAYRIRFLGHRTIDEPEGYRCGFGHMGSSIAEIVPTRILSIVPLEDRP